MWWRLRERDEHQEGCGDEWEDKPCAICRGEVSDEFLAIIEKAAAQPGRVMTRDEFEEWLDSL